MDKMEREQKNPARGMIVRVVCLSKDKRENAG
jgi:hypothetical protein